MLQEEDVGSPLFNFTLDEINGFTEEELLEIGLTREELIELSQQNTNDNNELNDNSCQQIEEYFSDNVYSSDEEHPIVLEISVDEESLKQLEEEEAVEMNVDDLPWLQQILEEQNQENENLDLLQLSEELNIIDEICGSTAIVDKNDSTIVTNNKPVQCSLSKKTREKKAKRLQEETRKKVIVPSRNFITPEYFWPNFEEIIKKRFPSSNPVVNIKNIMKKNLLEKFIKRIEKENNPQATNRIVIAFHGTSYFNIESIIEKGLLVPGKNDNGLSVVNGSAHGVGIYLTVMDPSVSIHYCGGNNQLFACAVLISSVVQTKNLGNVLVIFDEAQVLPCWLVTFDRPVPAYLRDVKKEEELKNKKVVNKTKKGEIILTKEERKEKRKKQKEKELKKKLVK